MSGGKACQCKDTTAERRKNWEVMQYKCNHSAFNGWRETRSDYSALVCKKCGFAWRTKAPYVDEIYYGQKKD